jgi:hypothetical protein
MFVSVVRVACNTPNTKVNITHKKIKRKVFDIKLGRVFSRIKFHVSLSSLVVDKNEFKKIKRNGPAKRTI